MAFKNIEKKSYLYSILKNLVHKLYHLYYDISVEDNSGVEQGRDAVIYAPNHQNALMDPLAVLFTRKTDLVFYARSDIFKQKIIAKFLYFLKILPVFRIRDGFDQLKKNQMIFDKTMDVISNGNGLVVFPEANHEGVRQLRSLKKGVSRVAFQAQHKFPDIDIMIVPVSLDFEHYFWFRSRLHIKYGKPIKVREFISEFEENQALGLNLLNAEIRKGIEPLMLHVASKGEDYIAVNSGADIITNSLYSGSSFDERLVIEKSVVDFLDQKANSAADDYNQFKQSVKTYLDLLKDGDLKDSFIESTKVETNSFINYFVALILSPIFLIGIVFNYLPYKLSVFMLKNIEDRQFFSTLLFTISSLVLFPVFYSLYFLVFIWFIGMFNTIVLLVFTLLSGMISYNMWSFYKEIQHRKKANRFISKNAKVLRIRNEIINFYNPPKV